MTSERQGETANLFVDLYAYRQRENKNPLEDWLTECLAVTIRALPLTAKAAFLAEFSGAEIIDPHAIFATQEIEVVTQYPAGKAGRPDMLVLLGGHPWILFENKVGHGVAIREGADGTESHQLRAYADWLAEHGCECQLPRAMVFVTHITPPPEDFRSPNAAELYHGFRRTSTSWGALGRHIARLTYDLPDGNHAKAMAAAFLGYLEEQDMSNDFPSSTAFAAAELYVGQAAALENLVSRMWDELKTVADFGKNSQVILKALTDEGSVGAWRYVKPGPKGPGYDTYLQTGIWFPEAGLWFDTDDLGKEVRGPQAYVFFGNGSDDVFADTKESPDGFLRPASDFLACKPLSEFPTDPQARGEEIIAWVAEQARILKAFLAPRGLIA